MDMTGTVKYIKIGKPSPTHPDACIFGLVPTGSQLTEVKILWWSGPPVTDPQWNSINAILQLLRDAYANQSLITVETDVNSAIVTAMMLGHY